MLPARAVRRRIMSRCSLAAAAVLLGFVGIATASPSDVGTVFIYAHKVAEIEVTLTADRVADQLSRGVLELSVPGTSTVMLVPITLMRGDFMQLQ